MKRIITSIVLAIYMVAAVGVSFSFHYCGGHYQSVQIGTEKVKSCCDDEEVEDDESGCCTNKTVKVSCKESHNVSETFSIDFFAHEVALLPTIWHYYPTIASLVPTSLVRHLIRGPAPPVSKIPLFLLHRVLRL